MHTLLYEHRAIGRTYHWIARRPTKYHQKSSSNLRMILRICRFTQILRHREVCRTSFLPKLISLRTLVKLYLQNFRTFLNYNTFSPLNSFSFKINRLGPLNARAASRQNANLICYKPNLFESDAKILLSVLTQKHNFEGNARMFFKLFQWQTQLNLRNSSRSYQPYLS